MPCPERVASGDLVLIQIVDSAMAEAVRRSGPHVVCKPGCTQCCMGPFPITQLDALRLRRGLAELEGSDPERALNVRKRAQACADRVFSASPRCRRASLLEAGAEQALSVLDDEEPCPALDPETGLCDLYAARPLTCREFGPPVRSGSDAVGVCELCFDGASEEEIAACAVEVDPEGREARLLAELEEAGAPHGETIVAFALLAEFR